MASAFKRCDYNSKKWIIDTTITFNDGSRKHFKRRGYNSKAEAVADFERAKNEFMKNNGFSSIKGTFEELLNLYLDYEKNRIKESTWIARKTVFDLYLNSYFKNKQIKNIFILSDLNKFKDYIKNLDLSVKRKNNILSEMRLFARFAYEREFISEKQFRLIMLTCVAFPKGISKPVKYTVWSFEEYKTFIKTFDNNDKYKVYFQFMFYTGVRFGESLAVQWKDFDIENKKILIYKSATNKNKTGGVVITTTKSNAGNRAIYINDSMMEQLLLLKEAFGQDPNSYLFFGQTTPIGRSTIRRKFTEHIKAANLPYLKIHEIRHTNNTWLLNASETTAGANITTKRLGRNSLKVTLDTYYHTSNKEEIELMDKFSIE